MEKWENPEIISENRLDSHAVFQEESISLNGRWRFLCVKANQELPERFFEPTFSSKHWELTNVPSSWEDSGHSQGLFYGDHPNPALSNKDKKTITLDSSNYLVGIYRKRFQIQEAWQGRKIILRFHDIRGGFSLWLNGQYVGMSKGSLVPVEFDISSIAQSGYNYICVQVWQYSDANYLDNPNQWILSGIVGDVEAYALPQQRIIDLCAQADFGDTLEDVQLNVLLTTENADGLTARIAVMGDNKVCYYGEGIVSDGCTKVMIPCHGVKLWSPELPHLYKIAVILWDGVGICHTRQIQFGFRKVVVEKTALMVNDQPITLKGVCYPSVDPASFETDIQQMKACNINAVRVFPPISERFYELCDQYGLYVLDDCSTPQQNPVWNDLYQIRAVQLVSVHRNHPCIILWNLSCGRDAIAKFGDGRPICGEDFYCTKFPSLQWVTQMEQLEDIIETPTGLARVLAAPTVISVESYKDKPLIALSYGGQTGNAAQKLVAYADIFRKSQRWCGGFFWNYKDQDFYTCDDPKCAVGLVKKDGVPHHTYYEFQKANQWLNCKRYDDGSICIKNHYYAYSTQDFHCSYEITRDGVSIDRDILELNIPAGRAQTIRIPQPESMYQAGRYNLTMQFVRKESPHTAVAYFQWELANNRHISDIYPGGSIRDDGSSVYLKAENASYTINRSTGNLEQISINDQPLLTMPLSPAFYRVKTDTELSSGKRLDEWAKLTLKNQLPKPSVFEVDHMSHQITVMQNIGSGLMRHYQLNRDGSLTVELRLRTGKTAPNRIGVQMGLTSSFDDFSWLGTGPWDTYADRKGYGVFGLYHQKVTSCDEHFRAQENGNKTNVCHAKLLDQNGHGLLITAEEPFECSVWPYSLYDLQAGDRSPTQTTININHLQNGLEDAVILSHSTYTYSFTIKPLAD